jgi:hypothetical protein
MSINSILYSADQFGSKFEFPIQGKSRVFNTTIGGATTLAIYLTGLIYFLYLFSIWVTNTIPPNIY